MSNYIKSPMNYTDGKGDIRKWITSNEIIHCLCLMCVAVYYAVAVSTVQPLGTPLTPVTSH